ncbi:MAG: PaaI family thioesterase, partial [Paracoccaceae bacterium]
MFADDPSQMPSPQDIQAMSGIEFMQGILNGTLPAAPIAQTLGYELHSIEPGRAAFRGAPGFSAMNPIGSVHGGWYGVLLDSAL